MRCHTVTIKGVTIVASYPTPPKVGLCCYEFIIQCFEGFDNSIITLELRHDSGMDPKPIGRKFAHEDHALLN